MTHSCSAGLSRSPRAYAADSRGHAATGPRAKHYGLGGVAQGAVKVRITTAEEWLVIGRGRRDCTGHPTPAMGWEKEVNASVAECCRVDIVFGHLPVESFPVDIHQLRNLVDVGLIEPEYPQEIRLFSMLGNGGKVILERRIQIH